MRATPSAFADRSGRCNSKEPIEHEIGPASPSGRKSREEAEDSDGEAEMLSNDCVVCVCVCDVMKWRESHDGARERVHNGEVVVDVKDAMRPVRRPLMRERG